MAFRSIAIDIARRTRTSLKGALSFRKYRWLMTFDGNSRVWRLGRFCFRLSLICTQSTRSMAPGNSVPRSYLPARKAAIREALSSSTKASIFSMWGRPATK